MSTPTSKEKGSALEEAVEAIEGMILRSSPVSGADAELRIEPNKVLVISGVKHEIDLFVSFKPATGYDSIYVFECKNWTSKKVSKNDIIVFSEKIRVASAQRGYFIATEFTSDAISQAALDPRVELVHATVDFTLTLASSLFGGVLLNVSRTKALRLRTAGATGRALDLAATVATLDGATVDLCKQADAWANEAISSAMPADERMNHLFRGPGTYPQPPAEITHQFAAGSFLVNGDEVREVTMRVEWDILVATPTYVATITGRGRHTRTEVELPDGNRIFVGFTEVPQRS